MSRASVLQTFDATRANGVWADVDRALVERAAAIPLVDRNVVVRLQTRGQLPVPPAVGHAARPALGDVVRSGRRRLCTPFFAERCAQPSQHSEPSADDPSMTCSRVYAGSTCLPSGVLGRHRRGADSLDSCGLARLGATGDDT